MATTRRDKLVIERVERGSVLSDQGLDVARESYHAGPYTWETPAILRL